MEIVIRLQTSGAAADVQLADGTRGTPEWTPELMKQADTAARLLLGDAAMVRQVGPVREYRTHTEWTRVVPEGPTPRR